MNIKWIGTAIIVLGCGGFGFKLAFSSRQLERELRELISILELLSCELRYRSTPLPELCLAAEKAGEGGVAKLFSSLRSELEQQISPDAACCMSAAVSSSHLSQPVGQYLLELGRTLGRFDLEGQLEQIRFIKENAARQLEKLTKDQTERIRSYQTLGLCAGAALAILLL